MGDIAIVRDSDNLVVKILRGDGPPVFAPEGCHCVPASELPEGWQRAPEAPEPVPESVSPYQFRAWCVTHDITMAKIDSLIDAIPDEPMRDLVRVEWEYGLAVRRSHPMIDQFGSALGLSSEQIDQAFREAATL